MYDTSRKNKPNKLKIDFGIPDYFKFYKNKYIKNNIDSLNDYNISSVEYNEIISDYNQEIKYLILNHNYDFKLPFQLGVIGIRKYKPTIKVENGKIITNNLPVNPRATRQLWDSNPEAKAKGITIRYTNKHTDGYVFTLKYFKSNAKYKNKSIYRITFKREFQREVSVRAKEGSLDAFIL